MSKGYQQKARENRKTIVKLLEEGKTDTEIMEKVGCCLSQVQHAKKALGVNEAARVKKICLILADLITTTDTMVSISKKRKIAYSTVKAVYRNCKDKIPLPIRGQGRPKNKAVDYAVELGITKEEFLEGLVAMYGKAKGGK